MRTDDIFEAITDIKDKYIEQARIIEDSSTARPVYKPLWKTLLPVAACVAAICAAGVLGFRYFGRTGVSEISEISEPSASSVPDVKVSDSALVEGELKYPEDAKYVTSRAAFADGERLDWKFDNFGGEFEYAEDYDALAAKSDLIILGTITDETRQNVDPEGAPTENGEVYSYGYLNVESVIKGNVKLGENVLIRQNSAISRDGSAYIQRTGDALSPMFKGDRWIYFLEENGGLYKPVNGAQGRYPAPGSNNIVLDKGEFDSFGTLEDSILGRDEIYAMVDKLLASLIQHIVIPKDGSSVTFYEDGYSYNASERGISFVIPVSSVSADQLVILESRNLLDLYLCDVGGDGKRDFIAVVNSNGAQSVLVIGATANFDGETAAGPVYRLLGNSEYDYAVEEENGVLYAVKRKFQRSWEQTGPDVIFSREPISLDKMEKVEIDLPEQIFVPSDGSETIFTLDDGSGIKYSASREGVFANGKCLIEGELKSLCLAKLDKSGAKFICAAVSRNGAGTVEILADKLYRLAGKPHDIYEIESKSYSLEIDDGTLNLVTAVNQYDTSAANRTPIFFDTLDMMTPVSSNDHIDEIKLGGAKTFAMEEFPDLTFTVTDENSILMENNTDHSPAKEIFGTGMGLANCGLYLCDLNGDGKRELCSWGSLGSGIDNRFVRVYDVANDEYYNYYKKADAMSELYSLDLRNGQLYLVTSEYGNENNVISRELLTLEILEKSERPAYEKLCLDVDSQFTLEEYPDYVFAIKTYEKRSNAISISKPNGGRREYDAGSAYLSDVDGDGNRELCMNMLLMDVESVVIWGYTEEGEPGEKAFFGDNCRIEPSANALYINYGNESSRPLTIDKSDFSPAGEVKYKEITPGEQYEIQSEMFDFSDDYTIESNAGTLSVTRANKLDENGEPCGDLNWSIYEPTTLYRYSYGDKQLLICTSPIGGERGYITRALEFAEDAFTCYELGKFSVMPQNGELVLVDNDGGIKPFVLPENGEVVRFR